MKVYTKSDDTRPSGWCASCRCRVEAGEAVEGLFVPGPRDWHQAAVAYLLCRRCARRAENDASIFDRVEARIFEVLPAGGAA